MASYFLGTISLGLVIAGYRQLRQVGGPSSSPALGTNLPFENTTTLVTTGVYRFVRHPLYASLLALAWCAYLKNPFALSSVALTLGVSGFLLATAIAEERENLVRFGAAYDDYMKRTRRFFPFLF